MGVQVGEHEGKWSEYDDRGVPAKNLKKKKPTKKEKEVLEAEYLLWLPHLGDRNAARFDDITKVFR